MLHCEEVYVSQATSPVAKWDMCCSFQSSVRTPASEPSAEKGVDEWLEAINELREEFSAKEYLPETSLAPPGQSKVDSLTGFAGGLQDQSQLQSSWHNGRH